MNTIKKALSIILSVMMILTVWVFVAPEKAGAVTATWVGSASCDPGSSSNEASSKAFDGDLTTKWGAGSSNDLYATCDLGSSVQITGYSIVTANDNASYHDRNPKSWEILGSNDLSSWDLVSNIVDDSTMLDVNYTPFYFDVSGLTQSYRYYKFHLISTHNPGGFFQISELRYYTDNNSRTLYNRLLGHFFSTSNVWYDAVTDNGSGLAWKEGDYPSYDSSSQMTYLNGGYLRITNESILSGVTRDTGLTFSFNYRPNFEGQHRHILSLGKYSYESENINNHLAICGATAWNSDGNVPMVVWVDGNGSQQLFAFPDNSGFTRGKDYNIVVSFDKNDGVVFYVDGVKKNTHYKAPDTNNNDSFENALPRVQAMLDDIHNYKENYIGCSRWHADAKIQGYLNDLRIYNSSLLACSLLYNKYTPSLDLATPSFDAKGYHCQYEATGAYSNLVYCPQNTTNFRGDGDDYNEIGAIYFKIATPANVVMVYDGVHEVYSPIEVETKVHSKTFVSNQRLKYVASNESNLILAHYWYGYQNGGGDNWQIWAGPHTEEWFSHQIEEAWDYGQNNTDTPRFWWNKLKYNGSGNYSDYYEYYHNISFKVNSPYENWGNKEGIEDLTSESNYYILNYKPIYDNLSDARNVWTELQSNEWKYTEESVARAKATIYAMSKGNPKAYGYSDVGGDVAICASYIKAAVQLIGAGGLTLVKKKATFQYFNDEAQVGDYTYVVDFGNSVPTPADPSKSYDDEYHYTFSNWANFNWNGYHDSANGTVIRRSANYTRTAHSRDYAYDQPTYTTGGTRHESCSGCSRTVDVQLDSLNTYVTVSDVVGCVENKFTNSFPASAAPRENGITSQLVGFVAKTGVSDPDDLALTDPSTSFSGAYGALSIENGAIKYEQSGMTFRNAEEFYAVIEVSGVGGSRNYSQNTVYTYEKVTIVPSQTMLFDDDFSGISYLPQSKWTTVSSNANVNNVGDQASQIVGSDYDDSVMYSLGSVHKTTVSSSDSENWPTASFTFTGTGFDLISVTSNDSGVFSYTITDNSTGEYVDNKPKLIDTYYGYNYVPLFYNEATQEIVSSSEGGAVMLYLADGNTPADKLIKQGIGSNRYTTDVDSTSYQTQAKGWIENSSSNNSLYQIPVISRTGLEYGTYTVTVQAMFNENLAHNGRSNYNLYVDGVRIYDPADKNDTISQSKYASDEENNPEYTSFRTALSSGQSILISEGNAFYIDGVTGNDLGTQNLSGYLEVLPKNELYIKPQGSISFSIDGSDFQAIKVGMKTVNGQGTNVKIAFNNDDRDFEVNTATEKYYSIKDLIGEADGTVTIRNVGSGLLSLTNLMTSESPTRVGSAPARAFSVNRSTYDEAIMLLAMVDADLTIDEDTIETTSSDDGTVTITLQSGGDASTIVIKDAEGNVVDPDSIDFNIDEEGVKNWVIVLTEEQSGEFTYTLQAKYENGYAPEEPTTVTVTVTIPEVDSDEPGNGETGDEENNGSRFDLLRRIKGLFERFIEFIRRIISLFR